MEVIEVIKQCSADGNILLLPKIELSREDYLVVKKAVEKNGGKRDLFVIIYSVVCGSLGAILTTLAYFTHWMENSTFVLLWNSLFLTITSSFVFIKPIGRFVDKNIIEKLP